MPRLARVIVPGCPHHVTHRGNRHSDVFFSPQDRNLYRRWLGEYAAAYGLQVWAYCLMGNHVHLIVLPEREDSLAAAIGCTHMRYARWVNYRQGWSGHLWANRFYSTPLDEEHLWSAVKYVERNPVRAGLVAAASEYPWSSARAHMGTVSDLVLSPKRPFPDYARVGDWGAWLSAELDEETMATIRHNTTTGRPTGSPSFVARLEAVLGRTLTRQKPGRKPRSEGNT